MKYTALCGGCVYFNKKNNSCWSPDDDARQRVGCPYLFGESEIVNMHHYPCPQCLCYDEAEELCIPNSDEIHTDCPYF